MIWGLPWDHLRVSINCIENSEVESFIKRKHVLFYQYKFLMCWSFFLCHQLCCWVFSGCCWSWRWHSSMVSVYATSWTGDYAAETAIIGEWDESILKQSVLIYLYTGITLVETKLILDTKALFQYKYLLPYRNSHHKDKMVRLPYHCNVDPIPWTTVFILKQGPGVSMMVADALAVSRHLGIRNHPSCWPDLTPKQLETHGCIYSALWLLMQRSEVPGHQYLRCWLIIDFIGSVLYKYISFTMDNMCK